MTLIPETHAKPTSTDSIEEMFMTWGWKQSKPGWAEELWKEGKKASEHYQKYGPEVPYGAVPHPKEDSASTKTRNVSSQHRFQQGAGTTGSRGKAKGASMPLIPETQTKATLTDSLAEFLISMGGKVAGYNVPDDPEAVRDRMERAFCSDHHYAKYGPEVPYGAVPHPEEGPSST